MKNFLKNNWFKILIAVILVTIAGGIFYWYKIGFKLIPVVNSPQEKIIGNGELTNEEINEISKSILSLKCFDKENVMNYVYGSGTYIHRSLIDGKRSRDNFVYADGYILTNAHVAILESAEGGTCGATASDRNYPFSGFSGSFIYDNDTRFLNTNIDIALLKYTNPLAGLKKMDSFNEAEDILKYRNHLLKNYTICPKEKIIGSNVYVFGYPATGMETQQDSSRIRSNLIVSTGIISGVDSHENYYTDAKIDGGSSGGLAASKIDGEICIVGIPTWASGGEFEMLGVIQPFWKILNTFKIIEL